MFEARSQLGKYRILHLLGRGGMGSVYLAEDLTLGREIALKILDVTLTSNNRFAERFREEARLIAVLEHPRIVGIHALEQIGTIWCIDMPFVRGGSLLKALAAPGVTPGQVVRWCGQVLDALGCCHESGVVHRDVKPSNILLTETGDALISDFGLAKILAEEHVAAIRGTSSSGWFLGTPKYAPPESWDGQEPTPAWDVYAVGMVLYEGITGRTPYSAETPLSLMKEMLNTPIPPLSEMVANVSPQLDDLVTNMLSAETENRPKNGCQALQELMKTPEFEAGAADTAITVIQQVRRRRRRPAWTLSRGNWTVRITTVLVPVVLLLATGVLWSSFSDSTDQTLPGALSLSASEDWPCEILDIANPEATILSGYCRNLDGGLQLAAFNPTSLQIVTLTRLSPESLSAEGFWAGYADATARSFSHGSLRGIARLMEDLGAISLVLDFTSSQDGSRYSRSFVMKRSLKNDSKNLFISRLADADLIQPMLYSELLPRQIPWALQFEQEWMGYLAPIATVPFVEDAGINVDGILEEMTWQSVPSETEVDGGRVQSRDRVVLFRYDEHALYIGISVPARIAKPVVALSVLDRFRIPIFESDIWHAEFTSDLLNSSRHTRNNRQIPWSCNWELKTRGKDSVWTCEVRIPLGYDGSLERPAPNRRWRVLCSVMDASSPHTPVASWGTDDDGVAWKGVLLRFGIQPEEVLP